MNRAKIFMYFVLALVFVNTTAGDYLEKGNEALQARQFDLAIRYYTLHLKENPKDAEGHKRLGDAYYSNNQGDFAMESYDRAIELKPDYLGAYFKRGSLCYSTIKNPYILDKHTLSKEERGKLFNLGIESYTKAIGLKPDSAEIYNARGILYCTEAMWDSAKSDINKAIKLNTNYSEAYLNRGSIYERLGEDTFAVKDYSKAIGIKPNEIGAYVLRAKYYSKKSELELAIKDYTKIIELKPSEDNYIIRGDLYYNTGNYEQAANDYTDAIKLNIYFIGDDGTNKGSADYDIADRYNSRGCAFYHLMEYDKAIRDFQMAIKLDKKTSFKHLLCSQAYHNMGKTYARLGKKQLARTYEQKFSECVGDYEYSLRGRNPPKMLE